MNKERFEGGSRAKDIATELKNERRGRLMRRIGVGGLLTAAVAALMLRVTGIDTPVNEMPVLGGLAATSFVTLVGGGVIKGEASKNITHMDVVEQYIKENS